MLSSANAIESAPPPGDDQAIGAAHGPTDDIYSDNTPLAQEYVPQTPLPLTRLDAARYDTQIAGQAAAEADQRAEAEAPARDGGAQPAEPQANTTVTGAGDGVPADAAAPPGLRVLRPDGN